MCIRDSYGTYSNETLVSIILSSYVIFIFTSLADTPAVYIARSIHDKEVAKKSALAQEH